MLSIQDFWAHALLSMPPDKLPAYDHHLIVQDREICRAVDQQTKE